MPKRFMCSHGHQWNADGKTTGHAAVCPVCGALGQTGRARRGLAEVADPEAVTPPPQAPAQTVDDVGVDERLLETLPPRSVPDDAPLPLAAPTSDDPANTTPPQIPGYSILDVLGRGGMGVVYKARDLQRNRLVALKMILVGAHAGKQERSRFWGEAQAIARLRHPNIVELYEMGECEGRPFFSLELVETGSLAGQLDGGPWPARKAARLVQKLARAVHHAHQCSIIHRDLKPTNVLLAADGTPKITDFGLAKQLDTSGCDTPSDAVLGTPSYMAPEQAGQAKHVGPAADVYSLGAILYELLTGQPPFQGATTVEIVMQVVSDDPVPPRRLRPTLAGDLETICLRCLHKDPAQRYRSAQALANDLGRFLAAEPVRARRSRPWDTAIKWAQRNPHIAILIGVVLLLLLVSFLQSMWFR
jgi:serine/threonine protein kinase